MGRIDVRRYECEDVCSDGEYMDVYYYGGNTELCLTIAKDGYYIQKNDDEDGEWVDLEEGVDYTEEDVKDLLAMFAEYMN